MGALISRHSVNRIGHLSTPSRSRQLCGSSFNPLDGYQQSLFSNHNHYQQLSLFFLRAPPPSHLSTKSIFCFRNALSFHVQINHRGRNQYLLNFKGNTKLTFWMYSLRRVHVFANPHSLWDVCLVVVVTLVLRPAAICLSQRDNQLLHTKYTTR